MAITEFGNALVTGESVTFDKVKVPILTYHSIDDSSSIISTSPQTFRQQMRTIIDLGFKTLSLRQFSHALRTHKPIESNTVVLTFDDGFANFYTEAFPVLQDHGLTATVFLVAGHCGGYNDWAGNPPRLPRSKLLSWEQIRELSNAGIEFGSHTLSHPDLCTLPSEKARTEVERSKKVIEDSIGKPVESFAYPFGSINAAVRQLASEVYGSACSTIMGKVTSKSDLHALERVDTYYLSNPRTFGLLPTKAMDRYIAFRGTLRTIKAAVAR
jgi:peptidoglycan/xylan/chitin deacetylase (PgdA/CDA1 family)